MALKDVYANTPGTDFAINFFWNAGANPSVGLLAAPFFGAYIFDAAIVFSV